MDLQWITTLFKEKINTLLVLVLIILQPLSNFAFLEKKFPLFNKAKAKVVTVNEMETTSRFNSCKESNEVFNNIAIVYSDSNLDKVEQLIADGLVYHDAGEIEKARDAYLQALDLDPENAKALDLAGLLCMQCGEPEAAEEFYRSAINIEPDNTRFSLHLGILYLEQNDFEKSEEILRKVIELEPDHSDARLYIALGMLRFVRSNFWNSLSCWLVGKSSLRSK